MNACTTVSSASANTPAHTPSAQHIPTIMFCSVCAHECNCTANGTNHRVNCAQCNELHPPPLRPRCVDHKRAANEVWADASWGVPPGIAPLRSQPARQVHRRTVMSGVGAPAQYTCCLCMRRRHTHPSSATIFDIFKFVCPFCAVFLSR